MEQNPEDPVKARLIEAGFTLEPARGHLEMDAPLAGTRHEAEAFVANAPPLYGFELDHERQFLALDIGVSAVQADPSFGGGYALISSCLYRMGTLDVDVYDPRAIEVARPWAVKAVRADPNTPESWEVLNEVYCYGGDFKAAEQALGQIYRRFGDGDLYARAAFLFFRLQGDMEQAMNWGALAWQQEWDNRRLIQTLFALGEIYRQAGRIQQAADTYRVITENDHENAWAFHSWAQCLEAMGDFSRALEVNHRAIEVGGGLHAFRQYQEHLKKAAGRAKMKLPGGRPPAASGSQTVQAPRALGRAPGYSSQATPAQ